MFNLKNELKLYKPFDKTEEQSVKDTLGFLQNNTNCFNRSNFEGHIIVGAFVCDNGDTVPEKQIFDLIDQSYNAVGKKKKIKN